MVLLLLTAGFNVWGQALPEWLIPLREAVYEQQLKADEIVPLYNTAKAAARNHYSGIPLDLALSRCEYLMGLVYRDEERKEEAAGHFTEGMRLAEKIIDTAPSAEAWQMLAENLSLSCQVRSVAFALSNGLNVEKFAKNALALNSRNAGAQYLIAARWVFAPAPLHNHKRGIQMMGDIIKNGDMEKDDQFRVYSAIGYAYVQQKKYDEARPWLLRSQEIYPTNKFVAQLLEKK
jgi:tetratricopeptide (TPR) repeat protein